MNNKGIIDRISQKGSDKEKIADEVIKDQIDLAVLLEGMNEKKAAVKFGCEKVLQKIGIKKPDLLYPYYDTFADLLDSENSFLKWGAIITISNMASVDKEGKFEKIFDKYFSPIPGPVLISAANVIGNSYKFALARREFADRIAIEILKVENAKYKTEECVNVAKGIAVNSFYEFFDLINEKEPVVKFVMDQLKSPRKPVRKKAEKFLRKYQL
ncbi:hypothetical protein ACFL7D_06040 [candidate division KSB1 bacterium]